MKGGTPWLGTVAADEHNHYGEPHGEQRRAQSLDADLEALERLVRQQLQADDYARSRPPPERSTASAGRA